MNSPRLFVCILLLIVCQLSLSLPNQNSRLGDGIRGMLVKKVTIESEPGPLKKEIQSIYDEFKNITPETLPSFENEKTELKVAQLYQKCMKYILSEHSKRFIKNFYCCYENNDFVDFEDHIRELLNRVASTINEKHKFQAFSKILSDDVYYINHPCGKCWINVSWD
jgi:hypothetical protein